MIPRSASDPVAGNHKTSQQPNNSSGHPASWHDQAACFQPETDSDSPAGHTQERSDPDLHSSEPDHHQHKEAHEKANADPSANTVNLRHS
jgi:hypothetical protein